MASTSPLEELLTSLSSEVSDLDKEVLSETEKAEATNLLRKGKDRSWIAITVIVTYSVAIGIMFLYILFTVPSCEAKMTDESCTALLSSWDKQAETLLNVITIAILPIVTLMLGFYFGTEQATASNSLNQDTMS